MTEAELRTSILTAVNDSPYLWRTVKGVAKEIGAPYETVEQIFSNSGSFVRSKLPNKNGEALYTTTDAYKRETPFLGRVFGAASNTVVG